MRRSRFSDEQISYALRQVDGARRHSAEDMLSLRQFLNRDCGETIVMVTHDPKAAEYATWRLHLDRGQLIDAQARTGA